MKRYFSSTFLRNTSSIIIMCISTVAAAHSANNVNLFPDSSKAHRLSRSQSNLLSNMRNETGVVNTRIAEVARQRVNSKTKSIQLNLMAGANYTAYMKSTERADDGSLVWTGSINKSYSSNQRPGEVLLIVNGSMVTGQIDIDNTIFSIRPIDNRLHVISELNPTKFQSDHDQSDLSFSSKTQTSATTFYPKSLIGNEIVEIRVLVLYTPTVRGKFSSHQTLFNWLYSGIQLANTSYKNSNVYARLKNAGFYQVNYTEAPEDWGTTPMKVDRNRLVSKNDGYMDDIHQLRKSKNADVVVLVTDTRIGSCGLSDIYANVNTAFAVVTYDCIPSHTLAHEIGHMFGARHNTPIASSPYLYGHGYVGPNGDFCTIMAIITTCPNGRINYWSNPDKFTWSASTGRFVPMGNTLHYNNTRVHNKRRFALRDFSNQL